MRDSLVAAWYALAAPGRLEQRVGADPAVSSDYFAVLGAGAVRGRTFLPEEERHVQGDPPAVISHVLWQGFFGADPVLVGKTVTLNGRGFTFVGVASPGFRGHTTSEAYDIWVPLAMNRVWASLLYGVRPVDPAVLSGVSLLLIASTLVASYLPARQATKVDPVTVMRAE